MHGAGDWATMNFWIAIAVAAAPGWIGLIYLLVLTRVYPLHRHGFDRDGKMTVEYPPRYAPGKVQRISG